MRFNPKPMTYNLRLITCVGVLLVTSYQLLITGAGAQTPSQVILTWQAQNFYPADFVGKAAATPNTPVTVSAEVIKDNKFIDVSAAKFFWYVDEDLIAQGIGLKEIKFTVGKLAGDSYFVRLTINAGQEKIESSVTIPISGQEVVIETGLPENRVKAESEISLKALPYFFNIDSLEDLVFSWTVNDQKQKVESGNTLSVKVGTPYTESQRNLNLGLLLQDKKSAIEFAQNRKKIYIY